MTTTKKTNKALTERKLHIYKEDVETTPYNDISIKDTKKHNSLSLGDIRRETAVERYKVLNKWQKDKHTSNIPYLGDDTEPKIIYNKNQTKTLKLAIAGGNQAPSLQEANKFDKMLRHNEFKEFYTKNNVVAKKLNKYLKGGIDNTNTIHKGVGRVSEKRKMKDIVNPKKSLNNSKIWNFLDDEVYYYQQPKNEKAKIFNHVKIIRNKDRNYLDESTMKTEPLHTTFARNRFEWKLLNKAATLYQVIPNLIFDNENSLSNISVNDKLEAERSLRYDTNTFINSKTPKPISLLKNIILSFRNAHANKLFNSHDDNGSFPVNSTTVTPSKFARKSTDEIVNRNSFDLKQTPSLVFTNLSSGSILSYNVSRTKINSRVGKEVTAESNSEDYRFFKQERLHRKKKKMKSIANNINDFTREPSKIAKYKKRLHPKLGELKDLIRRITISSTDRDEDIIKNLDLVSKPETLSGRATKNDNIKSMIYGNAMANKYLVDTRLSPHPTKKLFQQNNTLSRPITPVQITDNFNFSPELTLNFTDPRKIQPVKKHLSIKDVLFDYFEKLTKVKPALKGATSKNYIEMLTNKELQQNEFEVGTFVKYQQPVNDEFLSSKPNVRRSELATVYEDTVADVPPKYRSLKFTPLAITSKPVSEYKITFDSMKPSNIMQLKKSTENPETYTTTFKIIGNQNRFNRILEKTLNFKNSTYNTPMVKDKVKKLKLPLRNSHIQSLNVSESVKKDLTKLSSSTYLRPVFIESLKYPSVFDVYPNIGRWQPNLKLSSGVPTIVTNVSKDLTKLKMPPIRHWNAVVPTKELASYNKDMYLEEMMGTTYTENPVHIKLKQMKNDNKNLFHYDSKPNIQRIHKMLQDMYRVNTTALAIRSEILRQKARDKFLQQIEGVRNKDLIKMLFTNPHINQHLNVNLSLKKQPPDIFNRDMYSVLPLNVANYQKYKKEDRQSQKTNGFTTDNYYSRPAWVLPIYYKNKFHGKLQSTDHTSPFDKSDNEFLDSTISPETTVFPEVDVEDIVSDLADDIENSGNKLQSYETSAHDKVSTNIDDKSIYGTRKELAFVKHPLRIGQFDGIENRRNKEAILSNILRTLKNNTNTEKITLKPLNNDLLLSTVSSTEDLDDKDIPIIDERLRPIDKLANTIEKPTTESDDLVHYIEDVEKDYEPAKIHLITTRPKYPTVKSRKFPISYFKNMKTIYPKPLNTSGDEYPDGLPTFEAAAIGNSNNVFLSAPPQGKDDYFVTKPQKPTTSISTTTMTYATLPIRDDEVGLSLSKDLEDQESLIIDKGLPVQTFWTSKIFANTARSTTEHVFDLLLTSKEKSTNITEKLSTESDDLTNYIDDLDKYYEQDKTHLITFRPKYSTIKPRKFPTFKTHNIWEEHIDEKNMKTSYSKPLNGSGQVYPDNVLTYETAPLEDSNNLALPTYFTASPQRKDYYNINKPQKSSTSVSSRIMTYATLPITDKKGPSLSKDLENDETPIIDKDLRPVQQLWKLTTARTTTEPIFIYPTQALQENIETVLGAMSPNTKQMETEPIQNFFENQKDTLYERYSNNPIDNYVTLSSYATLSLQDDNVVSDSRKTLPDTATYLPIYRKVVTLRGKEKEEDGFYERLNDIDEVTTANTEVSYYPDLGYEYKNEEAIDTVVDQHNEYKSPIPTFFHLTVPTQHLTTIVPEVNKPVSMTPYPTPTQIFRKTSYENVTPSRIFATVRRWLIEDKGKKYDNYVYTKFTTTRPIHPLTLTKHKLKPTLSRYISKIITGKLRPTLTRHIKHTASRDDARYDKDEGTENDIIVLNKNYTNETTETKDGDTQSPMIDIGLRPTEDKWKQSYIYGKNKLLKKVQNYSRKNKDYDENFSNDKLTNDCIGGKCTSRKKYTTVIRPTNTYPLGYRITSTDNVILPNFEPVDVASPALDILSDDKVSSYTEINQDKKIYQETTSHELVTLSTVHGDAIIDEALSQKNYTKHVLDKTIEFPTENDLDEKFASNMSQIFVDKTSDDKFYAKLDFAKMFSDKNTHYRIGNDISSERNLLIEFSRNKTVLPFIETTIPPFDKTYFITKKFNSDKFKNKFNPDFWKANFFPKKTNPTKYSSHTSHVQKTNDDKNKLQEHLTNNDIKEKTLPIAHMTDSVQGVNEGTLTHVTTKYIQKAAVTSPKSFARIEHQSTSPIKSTGESGSTITTPYWSSRQEVIKKKPKLTKNNNNKKHYRPLLQQKYRISEPFMYPHNIYTTSETTFRLFEPDKDNDVLWKSKLAQYVPTLVSENLLTRPPFATTTMDPSIGPVRKPYKVGQDKQKVNASVKYPYPKNLFTTENAFNEKEIGAYPIVHSSPVGNRKGFIPAKSIYTTSNEDHNLSDNSDWKLKLFSGHQNIPIPIHTYSIKPKYANKTTTKESSHKTQGLLDTTPTRKAYFIPKITLASTYRPVPLFIPYATYPLVNHLSTKASNAYTSKSESLLGTDEYKYFDKSEHFSQGKHTQYPNKYPDEEKLFDQEIYPDSNRYRYTDKYPDKDHDKHVEFIDKNLFYQDQYRKPPLTPTVKGYENTGVYEYTNESIISSRPSPGEKSEDRYPDKHIYADENKYPKNVTFLDQSRNQYNKKELIIDKNPDKNKHFGKERFSKKGKHSGKERYPGKDNNKNKDKYDSYDTNLQEGKYYDQNYDHKFNYGYTPPLTSATNHDTFMPKRLPYYKYKYPDQYKHHFEHSTRNDIFATIRMTSAKVRGKFDQKIHPNDNKYSKPHGIPTMKDYDRYDENTGLYEDTIEPVVSGGKSKAEYPDYKEGYLVKDIYSYKDRTPNKNFMYPNKNKFYQDHYSKLPLPETSTIKDYDQNDENTGPYKNIHEPTVSPRTLLGSKNEDKYPDKYMHTHKDGYPHKNKHPNNNFMYPNKNKFYQAQHINQLQMPRMKDYDKYVKNANPHKFTNEPAISSRPLYGGQNKFWYPNNVDPNLYNTANYPHLFDVTTYSSVLSKPPTAKPARIDYGYDLIPGGIAKDHANDHRPKVPSLSDSRATVKLYESSTFEPPVVDLDLDPGEKDETLNEGSELPEINYENMSTLPYQPELLKLTNMFKKPNLPIKQPLRLNTTSKEKVPKFVQESKDTKPKLICGKDNSPISTVYEGAAKIETYPWLGVLVYPRGR